MKEWTPEYVFELWKQNIDRFGTIAKAHNDEMHEQDEQWRERFRKFEKIEEKFGPAEQREKKV